MRRLPGLAAWGLRDGSAWPHDAAQEVTSELRNPSWKASVNLRRYRRNMLEPRPGISKGLAHPTNLLFRKHPSHSSSAGLANQKQVWSLPLK